MIKDGGVPGARHVLLTGAELRGDRFRRPAAIERHLRAYESGPHAEHVCGSRVQE
jgi:hypothetical protein